MLMSETMNKLRALRLNGFSEALQIQQEQESYQELSFEERLGLLVDWEYNKRQQNKLERLIKQAKFQNSTACIEDVKYTQGRKLDRDFILELASCNYIQHAKNVIVVGATGAGKSFLAQALGQAACRHYFSTRYIQLPDLLDDFKFARAKGPEVFRRLRKQYLDFSLLILDEWLLFPIDEEDSQLLLSLIDRRHCHKSTIIVSQFEPPEWLDQIPIPVAAESITDRLASQAYKIILQGEQSMRSATD